jgi:hypothetical protein
VGKAFDWALVGRIARDVDFRWLDQAQ